MLRKQLKSPTAGLRTQLSLVGLALLLFLVALVVGFFTGFPQTTLRERVVSELSSQTGWAVSSDSLKLEFPGVISGRLTVDLKQQHLAPLELTQLQLRPLWRSLFGSAKTAEGQARLAAGAVSARVSSDDLLKVSLQDVQLGSLQKAEGPYRLQGVLQGELDASQVSQQGRTSGIFSATVRDLVVSGLEQLGLPENLPLGDIIVSGRLRGQRLSLEQVRLSGPFADISGSGSLQLGADPRRTRLNLRISGTPGPGFPAALTPLIELTGVKPASNGSYAVHLTGTLARPVVR